MPGLIAGLQPARISGGPDGPAGVVQAILGGAPALCVGFVGRFDGARVAGEAVGAVDDYDRFALGQGRPDGLQNRLSILLVDVEGVFGHNGDVPNIQVTVSFSSIRMGKGLPPPSGRTSSVHKRKATKGGLSIFDAVT